MVHTELSSTALSPSGQSPPPASWRPSHMCQSPPPKGQRCKACTVPGIWLLTGIFSHTYQTCNTCMHITSHLEESGGCASDRGWKKGCAHNKDHCLHKYNDMIQIICVTTACPLQTYKTRLVACLEPELLGKVNCYRVSRFLDIAHGSS
jgi:hypothetical protein